MNKSGINNYKELDALYEDEMSNNEILDGEDEGVHASVSDNYIIKYEWTTTLFFIGKDMVFRLNNNTRTKFSRTLFSVNDSQ